jgi:RHS repeat-associated protein
MYTGIRTNVLAISFTLFATIAQSQVATGTYQYGTFDTPGIDTINVANLNVHLSVPVLAKHGRGVDFKYNLVFDSSLWTPTMVNGVETWQPAQAFGWSVDTNVVTGAISNSTGTVLCTINPGGPPGGDILTPQFTRNFPYAYNFRYTDIFGVTHYYNSQTGGCPDSDGDINSSFTETAHDGSGLTLSIGNPGGNSVTDRSGKSFFPPIVNNRTGVGSIVDSNGNVISTDGNGNFTDTTGKVVLIVAGGAPNAKTFQYYDESGNPRNVQITYVSYTVQTKFNCSTVTDFAAAPESLVDTISFPDGTAYHFSYEETTPGVSGIVTGRLATIELPQGGSINYSYSGGNNGINCADGSTAVLTRTLASDSGSAASTWSYTRSTGTRTSHTEVVDGLLNHKAYDFVQWSAAYYETNRSVYQGAESGTAVLARQTCYNGTASPCTTTAISLPITQIDTYETLDGIQMHGSTAKFNTYGAQTEADDYDFGGPSSRGPLLRKEVWTYGYTIPGLVTLDQIYNGSNSLGGETVYVYDGGTLVTSSGVPQHQAVTGARGNLTGATQYANSTISYQSSATYEDTGSPLTSTTPNGTTTLSYDPTFVYLTSVTPPTPFNSLKSSATYDTTYTGLPLTSTDPNSAVTTVQSYDLMLRPTQIDFADGGMTTLSYSATQNGMQTYQTSSVYGDTETQLDGFGRQSRVEVQNSTGWYQTDTCYDANGNPSFTTYPYQGADFTNTQKVCYSSSPGGDTKTYDVRGRVTRIVRANGETKSFTYLGRARKFVDENGVARISQVDGLGRIATVCEISSNTLQGVSPVSCGTDITGATGFLTNYAYSLSTHTTTITQGAQTRMFQTDWLGRSISVQEPESGTTSYSYLYNSTGLKVTRTRPEANQQISTVLTTTTTQYDLLGRVVSIGYSDGTPTKSFTYDANAGADFTDLTQANLKGRLSLASVPTAMTAYSYDPVGRTKSLDECLPSGPCGTVANNHPLQYTYDWAGNLLSSTDGGTVTSTYTVSPANEVLSLTSSLGDPTDPANIVSGVQNGPTGPVSYNLGNGLSNVYGYDAIGRMNGGWVCAGSSSPSCSGGTMVYGFTNAWSGHRLTGSSDSVLNQGSAYGYDEFNRITSRTVNSGTVQNYTYTYDRYGNRWTQNALQGGLSPQFSFNPATNQITNSGFVYDAAGNMTNDGYHTYTYDGEGNITAVDGGQTAQYVYNALNQRVRSVVGSATTEYVFNAAGQRVSEWNGTTHAQLKGKYYWGTKPVAYYAGGTTHFEHQDWLGTERARTNYNASSVEGSFTSLPFGDNYYVASGVDGDGNHFAMLDHDTETNTDHAQFRQYNNSQGRWMRPDPDSGSYKMRNPQSFNRYVYAANRPLSVTDPLGLDGPDDPCSDPLSGVVCYENDDGGGDGNGDGNDGDGNDPSNPTCDPNDPSCSQTPPCDPADPDCGQQPSNNNNDSCDDSTDNSGGSSDSSGSSDSGDTADITHGWRKLSLRAMADGTGGASSSSSSGGTNKCAPNNGECDNACQLAHAFNKTGVYSLTSVCFVPGFYAASAAGATGAVAVANAPEVYAATAGDYATWYGRAVSWLYRMVGKTPTGAGTAIAAAPAALSQFCSSH